MKIFLPALVFILSFAFTEQIAAQAFPNPALLSTGQGAQGSLDPIWLVSGWYGTPPNPIGLTYTSALISNNCAPGSWIPPSTLTPPENNGNWITNPNYPCATNTNAGYIFFRLTVVLPPACNGESISAAGAYTLYLSGYVDNTISDVYVNGTSTGIHGGSYGTGQSLNMTLTGPWVPGANYIDVLVYNTPGGSGANPYGLLLVANSTTTYANGCPPAIAGDTFICPGVSTQIWVNETGYNYLWSNGATTDTITVSPGATTDYSVTVSNTYGFSDVTSAHVTVYPATVITINPPTPAICVGNSATLTASGNGTNYLWGNGTTTTAVTVMPTSTTSYFITVTTANNCSASDSATVTVNPLPTPAINPVAAQICLGTNTTFTASGGTGYSWSNTATTATITVSPTTTTTYVVTVTDANTCSATTSINIIVNPLPVAVINPATTQICLGASAALTASSAITYAWSDAETTASITISPLSTTIYSVTATDANTCTGSASSTVTVNNPPVAVINPATVQICLKDSTTLTASGGAGYLWNNAVITAAITISPSITTTYSVTVTDIHTCIDSATSTVTVNPLPIAVITPATAQICEGNSAALTASGGTVYLWSNAATTAAITVSPLVPTAYTITVTDANNCTSTASAPVAVDPYIILSAMPTNVTCNGADNGKVDLTVSGGQNPYGYLWSTTATGQNLTGVGSGNYMITVTDALGCTASVTAALTEPPVLVITSVLTNPTCVTNSFDGGILLNVTGGVIPYQYFWSDSAISENLSHVGSGNYSITVTDANGCTMGEAFSLAYIYEYTIQATTGVTIKLGESTTLGYTLTGNAGNYVNFWNPTTSLSCVDCVAPVASPTVTTLYQVEVKNDVGCIATDTVTVTVIPDYDLFVPNVFTPNGDGKNDVFQIFGNLSALEYMTIRIFNRWGETVFESNDPNFAWDGTYKGTIQLPGVFIWELKLVFTDGHSDGVRKGTLTLLR